MDDDYRDVVAIEVCHVQKPVVWVEGNANWSRTHGYDGHNKFKRGIGLLHCRQQETKVYPSRYSVLSVIKGEWRLLLVVAAILYLSAVRQSTVKETKLHSTRLFVLKTLGVWLMLLRSVTCGDGIVDAAGSTLAECFCSVYWCLKPRFLYPLSVRLPLLACNRVWPYWWHHCIVCN